MLAVSQHMRRQCLGVVAEIGWTPLIEGWLGNYGAGGDGGGGDDGNG